MTPAAERDGDRPTSPGGEPGRHHRRAVRGLLAATAVAVGVLVAGPATPADAYPPTPPDETISRAHLDRLTVESESSSSGYDRDLFPHWEPVDGNCDAREVVLQRDGVGVDVDGACQPVAGSWYSVYDAVWVTDSSEVDIDHIVALSEAWRSGADGWSESTREAFANDLQHSQLIAVSSSSNSSKSDKDPSEWVPPNSSVHCIYAREWIDVKYVYDLSVDSAEKSALHALLDSC